MRSFGAHNLDRTYGMYDPFYKDLCKETDDELDDEFDEELDDELNEIFDDEFDEEYLFELDDEYEDVADSLQSELDDLEDALVQQITDEVSSEMGEVDEEFLGLIANVATPLIGKAIGGIGRLIARKRARRRRKQTTNEFEADALVGDVQEELAALRSTLMPEIAAELEVAFEGEMDDEFLPILAAATPLIGSAIRGIGQLFRRRRKKHRSHTPQREIGFRRSPGLYAMPRRPVRWGASKYRPYTNMTAARRRIARHRGQQFVGQRNASATRRWTRRAHLRPSRNYPGYRDLFRPHHRPWPPKKRPIFGQPYPPLSVAVNLNTAQMIERYGQDIISWVRPQIVELVKEALKGLGYSPTESAMSQVAPLVTNTTGDDVQDELAASKALRRIENSAVKKAAQIKAAWARSGRPISFKRAADRAVARVVAQRAPLLLRAAHSAA